MDSAQLVYARALKEEERAKDLLDTALRRAEALRNLKRYQEALEFLNEWRPPAIEAQREGEFLIRIHELQALLGKPQDAIKGYRDVIERYPGALAYEAQFQIGYLYETALGDLEQAAREYEKLKTAGGGSQFAAQAVRRSQSLTTLRQFQQALAADTTGAGARTAFRLAEVYYFELGKTDSALTQYRAVESLYPRSVYAPKSAYARLWITAYDRNDTLGAMQITDVIAARYRGTRYAESALYLWKRWSGRADVRTALFDSLLAHPDTSAASTFAEETEPPPPPETVMPPTASAPDSGYQVSPEVMKRLQEAAEEARRRKRGGKSPPPPEPPRAPSQPAPADTTQPGAGGTPR